MKAFKYNLLNSRINSRFFKSHTVFFSTKLKRIENSNSSQINDIKEVSDYKICIDKTLEKTIYSINVPFYLSTIYLAFLRLQNPINSDDFTTISRITLCLINTSQCFHSGISLGIVSRINSLFEIKDEKEIEKNIKKNFLINLLSLLASFGTTNVLLSGTVTTYFPLYIASYWAISGLQLLTNYYSIQQQILPLSLMKIQLYNFAIFTVFLMLFYGILNEKKNLLKRTGDNNRIENLKIIDDIILDDEELILQENEEIMKFNPDVLEQIYNQKN